MTAAQEPASETPETKSKKSLGFFSADALKKLFGFGGYRPNLRTALNALGPERGTAEEALGATLFERFGPLLPHLTVDDEGFRGVLIMFLSRDLILGGFLSILPHKRNGGLGTAVLQAVRARYAGKPVCLEIEDPEEPGAPNAELRRRRRNFYLRNGIVPIAKMRVYDTDMELLATDETVTFEAYEAVLRSVMGAPYVDSHLERR